METLALPIALVAFVVAAIALFGLGNLSTEVRRNRLREIERGIMAKADAPPPGALVADTICLSGLDDHTFEDLCHGRYRVEKH